MDSQEGILDELGLGPFTRLDTVVGFNVSIHCKIFLSKYISKEQRHKNQRTFANLEANVVPVYVTPQVSTQRSQTRQSRENVPMVLTGGGGKEDVILESVGDARSL
jgi:hypothetical protein